MKFSGDPHKVTATINLLNRLFGNHDLLDLCVEPYQHGRKDGLREQTAYLDIDPERHYDTKAEKALVERPGYVYLFRSNDRIGIYKIGESEDRVLQRVKEVSGKFEEDFERIHSIHCKDRFATESYLHDLVVEWGAKALGYELFEMTDGQVEKFISLPNEL